MSEFLVFFMVFGLLFIPVMIILVVNSKTRKDKIDYVIMILVAWLVISTACGGSLKVKTMLHNRSKTETEHHICPTCHKEIEI